MTIAEMKNRIENHRNSLRERVGKVPMFDQNGPAGMEVIDALASAVEELEKRIKAIEDMFNKGLTGTFP